MRVIVAPEKCSTPRHAVSVFLAGGITKCPEWQDDIIDILDDMSGGCGCSERLYAYNPRRKNFPIHDSNAAREQITWEFNALNVADIFSMWFCNADSDQPICMYELGRHLARNAYNNKPWLTIVGVEPGYRREQDVRIQTELVAQEVSRLHNPVKIPINRTLEEHAAAIVGTAKRIMGE